MANKRTITLKQYKNLTIQTSMMVKEIEVKNKMVKENNVLIQASAILGLDSK